MEIAEKIKILAKMKVYGIRKLVRVGDSYAMIVPIQWLSVNAIQVGNDYYVAMRLENNDIIFSPVDKEFLEEIIIRRK